MSTLTVSNITASNISGLSTLSIPTLQSANIYLEDTGNNRIELVSSNTIAIVAAGANAVVANSTSIRAAGLTSLTGTTVATIVDPTIPTSGSATLSPKVSFAAVNSTTGTSIDFTGIPSWVRQVTVMFAGVSTNGISSIMIQIGDSGGIETTGYLGSSTVHAAGSGYANYTTGFGVFTNQSATTISGSVTISLLGSNRWVASGVTGMENAAGCSLTGGQKTLSATLDRVRITTVNGTDAFDTGIINVMYE